DEASVRFAVLSPQSLIDAANASSRERLLLGLLACIAFVSLVAYFEGRSIVRSLRALAEAAHGIALGRLSDRVPVRGRDEGEVLVLPLTVGRATLGTLYLVGGSFDEEQRMNGASFASQAAIALENARLHRIVERQALVDGLTGIANRRQCEKLLTAEVARAERLGTPFTLVLADLDDFKAV